MGEAACGAVTCSLFAVTCVRSSILALPPYRIRTRAIDAIGVDLAAQAIRTQLKARAADSVVGHGVLCFELRPALSLEWLMVYRCGGQVCGIGHSCALHKHRLASIFITRPAASTACICTAHAIEKLYGLIWVCSSPDFAGEVPVLVQQVPLP